MTGEKKGVAHLGLLTFAVMSATIMHAIDTTIPNVALPHMQGSLLATQEQIAWVLTSYIVAAAVMTPPTGALALKLGRRRLFVVAILGFTAASALCGTASTLTEMLVYRTLQGAFGAGLIPLSQATLLDVRTPREYAGGFVPGAINIPIDELRGRVMELPRDRKVQVYCAVGMRGYLATRILKQAGFDVMNLGGGYKTFQMMQ